MYRCKISKIAAENLLEEKRNIRKEFINLNTVTVVYINTMKTTFDFYQALKQHEYTLLKHGKREAVN